MYGLPFLIKQHTLFDVPSFCLRHGRVFSTDVTSSDDSYVFQTSEAVSV